MGGQRDVAGQGEPGPDEPARERGEGAPEEAGGRSPVPDCWTGDGPTTDSAYSSSGDSQNPWPGPPRDTPGSRARAAEVQAYCECPLALDVRQAGWSDTNQPDQSFFTAAAALHSATRGVPPHPDGHIYMVYPAEHPARRFMAAGLRDLMVGWMGEEPERQHYPPEAAQPDGGPQAPLSADILRTRGFHPGADCLLPLLARLVGRPVALIIRVDRRYLSPTPAVRVYRPRMHNWLTAEVQGNMIVEMDEVDGTPAPCTHDPATILMIARMGAPYTALSPRTYPTRYMGRPS